MQRHKARSRSDTELADWVSRETDIPTSGWQIERWRQAGLLQPATRPREGRGSTATYSGEARQQAAELARLSRHHRRHDEIARILFARGLYVREDSLRRALTKLIERVDAWIGPSQSEKDLDRIDAKARKVVQYARRTGAGKRLQRRLRRPGVNGTTMAAGVYYNLLHLVKTGLPTTEEGFTELLEGYGLMGFVRDQIDGVGPIAPDCESDVGRFLREASLAKVRTLLVSSSLDDLKASRDLVRLHLPILKDFAVLATTWFQLPDAFGFGWLVDVELDDLQVGTWVPFGLALLPYVKTPQAQDLLAKIAQSADYFHQMATLARSVPPEVIAAMRRGDPNPLEGLPTQQREKIVQSATAVQIAGESSPWASYEPTAASPALSAPSENQPATENDHPSDVNSSRKERGSPC
jgi:hypothetical protein